MIDPEWTHPTMTRVQFMRRQAELLRERAVSARLTAPELADAMLTKAQELELTLRELTRGEIRVVRAHELTEVRE